MNKTNLQELLPLGSIVTLKKGTKKIMICGRICLLYTSPSPRDA